MGCNGSLAAPNQAKSDFQKHYALSDEIVQGDFVRVCRCIDKKTGTKKTVKVVPGSSPKERAQHVNEYTLWRHLGTHINIASLKEIFHDVEAAYFVMENSRRSLQHLVSMSEKERSRVGVSESYLLNTFHHMICGLCHCHSLSIVLRDLRPSIVLLDSDGVVKLCAFEKAVVIPDTCKGLRDIAGAAAFMSPEMASNKLYGMGTDIWSCGVIAYLLLYGAFPYQPPQCVKCMQDEFDARSTELIMQAIRDNDPKPTYMKKSTLDSKPSTSAEHFVKQLLTRSMQKRPSAKECLHLGALAGTENHRDTREYRESSVAYFSSFSSLDAVDGDFFHSD